MTARTGTLGTAPFVIQDTDIPQPAILKNTSEGGHHQYPKLSDGTENSLYGIKEHHRSWGMKGVVYDDTTNNGTYELWPSHVDNNIMNNANWRTFSSGIPESLVDSKDQAVKDELRASVETEGNTLKKLYDLIVSSFSEKTVADITARNAYNVTKLPTNVFVTNDGDGNWALYKATTLGINATYVKLSDPDLLNAVMTASQIKASYESNPDTNAFTNALLAKLNGIAASATANAKASSATVQTGTDDVDFVTSFTLASFWTYVKTLAQTFAAKITFTAAPRFDSVTASRVLKVDANKDLISEEIALTDLAQHTNLSVVGNPTNAQAKPTTIAATIAERILARTASNTLAWVQATTNMLLDRAVTTIKIALNAVTNTELAQMPANTVKSNLSGSTANAADYPATNLYNAAQAMYQYDLDGLNEILSSCFNTGIDDTTVANTVVETSLYSVAVGTRTLPGYFFKPGKTLRVRVRGHVSTTGSSPTINIRIKLGSTVLLTTGSIPLAGTITNNYFEVEAAMTCRTIGTAGTIMAEGKFLYDNTTSTGKMHGMVNTAPTAINTTVDQVIDCTVTWGTADAANSIKSTIRAIDRVN